MTLQTPLHLQRRCLIEDRHVVDPPVTRRTTDTLLNVNAVIEIRVVRQVVNSDPLDRLAVFETRAHPFEVWTLGPDLLVTVHARRGRWQSGGRRSFHRRMTVTAVDAVVADVMFVTELNRLLSFDPLTCIPGRTIQLNRYPKQSNNYEESAINRNLCQRVSAVMENLWHCRRIK